MAVVNTLKNTRKKHGISQKGIADATGFSIKTVSRVEQCEQAPSAEFMLRVAAYFNLMVEDIFQIKE